MYISSAILSESCIIIIIIVRAELMKRAPRDVRGPVITFLVALLHANYERTGVSSKKTGGTSIKITS